MLIKCPGSEWVVKLGPITRTNTSGSREQSVQGAIAQLEEDSGALLQQAAGLLPLLRKGALCAGDCGLPEPKTEGIDPEVATYQLPDGKWFTLASSGVFGYKLVCKG